MIDTIQLPENLSKELDGLLSFIVSDPSVRSVILFGSTAQGTRHEHSDIDLLVLVEGIGSDHDAIASGIRREAFAKVSFPLDLIIESIQDFQDRATLPTLERKIAREGKVLYAA
jgi:uncharacterized protein